MYWLQNDLQLITWVQRVYCRPCCKLFISWPWLTDCTCTISAVKRDYLVSADAYHVVLGCSDFMGGYNTADSMTTGGHRRSRNKRRKQTFVRETARHSSTSTETLSSHVVRDMSEAQIESNMLKQSIKPQHGDSLITNNPAIWAGEKLTKLQRTTQSRVDRSWES